MVTLAISCLQPNISINDCDAEAYLMGAQSLRDGKGYVDTFGGPINNWPPGYSFILSLTSQPKIASLIINYVSFGVAIVFLYILAMQSGWPRIQGLALALAIGFGFLYHLAVEAKPDILTYALFLVGVKIYYHGEFHWRLLGCFLLAALIPIKYIALAFVPGILLADLCRMGISELIRRKECIMAGCFWMLFVIGTMLFNHSQIHGRLATHSYTMLPTPLSLVTELECFTKGNIVGFFRAGVVCWYGSIRAPIVLVPYVIVLAVGLASLVILKASPDGASLRWAGLGVLSLSWVLQWVLQFYADQRLLGYGMLLILLGFRPRTNAVCLWPSYAVSTFILTVYNTCSTVHLGINHPQYRLVAKEASHYITRGKAVFTNAKHILDVQENIPSQTVENLKRTPNGAYYLEVTLPNYDAIDQPIGIPCLRDKSWEKVASFQGGTLFQKKNAEP